MRKKKSVASKEPYHYTDDVYVVDFNFKEEPIKSGALLKIRNDRSVWVFECMYYNRALDVEWINLRSQTNGEWKSVRPDAITSLYVAKRSRRKVEQR
ncbi:hypothetical protein SEA_WEASELS2_112 [Rhodococcus phage Weasels2]|uniref:DUF7246 domain-containing protein n=1 Tax=Rhodococcus phage Weasels2 TaxID=1897437 RepID=A0A1I9SA95_9CAUD|nr:hypothetical protein FDH04_gp112 [Rhodococcus phage Weasels2]AOZ63701.1 hypothetical protein SEA_WEASELS2_112 [Rhodococcus phage Weasels2]